VMADSAPKRVLVIESDPRYAGAARQAVQAAGSLELHVAGALDEALVTLERCGADVVWLGLPLAGANLEHAIAELRRRAAGASIIVAGSLSPEAEQRARQAGADDYVPKGLADAQLLPRAIAMGLQRAQFAELNRLQDELLRAQKLESIGRLAGGIAHDFNNLLTAILGNISLAKRMLGPEDAVYQMLLKAEKASLRAKDLTQQLLTFARVGEPVRKPVALQSMLPATLESAVSGGCERYTLSLPAGLWPLHVDEAQIGQALRNLIVNADQSMPQAGKIDVQAENVIVDAERGLPLRRGRYVCITIRDEGPGIAPENVSRIFDPYFSTRSGASGLALATAYHVVKNHEGHIEVLSQPGAGASFRVYLPASEEEPPKPEPAQSEPSVVGPAKILVIDDEEITRETLGQMLERMGHQVEFAREGGEALASYQRARQKGAPFGVVIIDLVTSQGMAVQETLRRLLELDSRARAIVAGEFLDDLMMSNYRHDGFLELVSKPFRYRELQQAIERALRGAGGLPPAS
jgi:signal transduction histidine kinase